MNQIKVSQAHMSEILANIKGCKFISVDALALQDVREMIGGKSGNPNCGKVYKHYEGHMMLAGASYEKMVNKRTQEAGNGEFAAKDNWHEKVGGALYAKKSDPTALYLAAPYAQKKSEMAVELDMEDAEIIKAMESLSYDNIGGKTTVLLMGEDGVMTPTTHEAVGLKKSKGRGGEQGGLNETRKVMFRTFKLENLKAVRLDGVEYVAGW